MKWVAMVLVLLIVLPAVTALYASPPKRIQIGTECRTNQNCFQLARTTQVACAPGLAAVREPQCQYGKCELCKAAASRLRSDCRYDVDCAGKVACGAKQFSRCIGNKCVCTSQQKPDCYRDHDCVRPFILGGTYERRVCQRGKCIAPAPLVTSLPRAAMYAPVLPKY